MATKNSGNTSGFEEMSRGFGAGMAVFGVLSAWFWRKRPFAPPKTAVFCTKRRFLYRAFTAKAFRCS